MDGEICAHEDAHEKEPDHTTAILSDASAMTTLGMEAMNALSVGIVIVDRRGFVGFANAKGTELLDRRAVFRSTAPLALHDAGSQDALRSALAAASVRTTCALKMRDRAAQPAISAVVVPLGSTSRPIHASEASILLAMNELFAAGAIPNVWLSQLFGLTPTESSVTNWIVTGRPIEEYARDRGVSLATVRSQIKTVLAKTGMSRQVQLVAALARLPIECPVT